MSTNKATSHGLGKCSVLLSHVMTCLGSLSLSPSTSLIIKYLKPHTTQHNTTQHARARAHSHVRAHHTRSAMQLCRPASLHCSCRSEWVERGGPDWPVHLWRVLFWRYACPSYTSFLVNSRRCCWDMVHRARQRDEAYPSSRPCVTRHSFQG